MLVEIGTEFDILLNLLNSCIPATYYPSLKAMIH